MSEMPASRSEGSMTMRASSSTVPRSATAASRSEASAQAGGGDLLQSVDECAQHLVLVVARTAQADGVIADVRGRGGGARLRISWEMAPIRTRDVAIMESKPAPSRSRRFSEASQTTAASPGPGRRAVGGEPDVRQEDLAVAPLRLAFHVGAQVGGRDAGCAACGRESAGRARRRRLAATRLRSRATRGRFVGQRDAARVIQGEDGERAGLDQDAHLLLGLLAQADLLFAFRQMFRQTGAGAG